MYKRRVKRTVAASSVPLASSTQESSTAKEPVADLRKTSSCNTLDQHTAKEKDNIQVNEKKPGKVANQTKAIQDSTNGCNMRFTAQDKQVPYFEKVLSSCGFDLHSSESFVLSDDQAIFIRNLKMKLERSSSFPTNVTGPDGFLQTLEEFCTNPENLHKALQMSKTADNGKVWKNFQNSLMRLLLSVEFLQKRLIEFLCEKLVELVCSTDSETVSEKNHPWTQLILYQFKFLDEVVDPNGFLSLLFDVLQSIPEKGYVLSCLPDIIQDSQHEETAKKLSELLVKNWEMSSVTPSILEALTNLTLTQELQKSVTENVMRCLGSVQLDYLPNMVRFLVTVACPEELPKIVSSFRQYLDFTSPLLSQTGSSSSGSTNSKVGPVETCELLTMEVLKWSVMVSRPMAEAWLDAIRSVHSSVRHRPLDLVMLLILYAERPEARPSVQALFRNKARQGLFREKLLATTFSTMIVVIKEYRTTLMTILFVLLKSPDPSVVDHASCWYKLCLVHLPSWQAQAFVHHLLLHTSTGSSSATRAALAVLGTLATEHIDTLLPHQWLLLNLMDKIPYVDVNVVEMIMEILCRVAFGSESKSGTAMDDNILMLARKQLASWNPDVRKKGVVTAVIAAKHMAIREADQSPAVVERVRQAIQLMVLVTASTENFPDAKGLFLDKLSTVLCRAEDADEDFLAWITEYIGKSFEEKYIVPKKCVTIEEDLKLMFNMDDPQEEEDDDICIPLANLVERDTFINRRQYPPIVVMPASLRLVRCVKFMTCEGSLADIAALLTCPVLMPKTVEDDTTDFAYPQEQNFLLDCVFHCVNWFRELISAFAIQKNPDWHRCVLLRLKELISLQRKLACWLTLAIDYTPPPSQFFGIAKTPKLPKGKKPGKMKGKKRKRKSAKGKKKFRSSDGTENPDEEEVDEEEASNEDGEDEEVGTSSAEGCVSKTFSSDLTEFRGFLREMDVDVIILLKESLVLPPTEENNGTGLNPPILLFLLQDLTAKVEYLLAPEAKRISSLRTASVKPVGFTNLEVFTPRSFIENTIKILPALIDKLEAIGGYCQGLLDQSDNIRDAPSMFPENSSDVRLCYTYIIRILAGLFQWSGFESKMNSDNLKSALRVLVVRDSKEAAAKDRLQGLLSDAASYLQSYVERTLLLSAAWSLVKVLQALCHLADGDAAMRSHVESASKNFLGQRWYDTKGCEEKGAEFNRYVDALLKAFFNSLTNKLDTVSKLVSVVYQEFEHCVKMGGKDWSLNTFPTITKNNFSLLYRALCLALVQGVEETLEGASNDNSHFKVWETSLESLRGLMMIVRLQNSRSILVSFVKNSLRLLKTFLKRGLPLFVQSFRYKVKQVTAVLQTLQKSTRFLNAVCYHSKSTKDVQLTSQVPALRLVLEQIVVSVRTMLAKNDCSDAFWIGVLKNRNLKGEEVLSQQNGITQEEEQEQDLPPDDDSDVDVDLDNAEEQADSGQDSHSALSLTF